MFCPVPEHQRLIRFSTDHAWSLIDVNLNALALQCPLVNKRNVPISLPHPPCHRQLDHVRINCYSIITTHYEHRIYCKPTSTWPETKLVIM